MENLKSGEIVYLPLRQDGYHLMLKVSENGELAIRIVRFAASEEEKETITEYTKEKDREIIRNGAAVWIYCLNVWQKTFYNLGKHSKFN